MIFFSCNEGEGIVDRTKMYTFSDNYNSTSHTSHSVYLIYKSSIMKEIITLKEMKEICYMVFEASIHKDQRTETCEQIQLTI